MICNLDHNFKVLVRLCLFFWVSMVYSQNSLGDIPLPSNEYYRIRAEKGTFAEWLRNLPLKPKGESVLNYRGGIFKNDADSSVARIIKMDIHARPLEQCMDIIIRFYAEYLWQFTKSETLGLPLPGGSWLYWNDWRQGFRPRFKGINVELMKSSDPDSSYKSYEEYLRVIYSESHTQQFYHAYKPIDRREVRIGDFIVRKGTKGHAVLIVDIARNPTGDFIALIGNGDTPACEFFLLNYKKNNPWVPLNLDQDVIPLPLRRQMTWDGLRRFSEAKNRP